MSNSDIQNSLFDMAAELITSITLCCEYLFKGQ